MKDKDKSKSKDKFTIKYNAAFSCWDGLRNGQLVYSSQSREDVRTVLNSKWKADLSIIG
jgi:hypothetical protein